MLEEDDPETVERMLLYCYTDDYDDGTMEGATLQQQRLAFKMSKMGLTPQLLLDYATHDPLQSTSSSSSETIRGDPPVQTESALSSTDIEDSQRLINNTFVYAIADKYGVAPLKDLAMKKFCLVSNRVGLPQDFTAIIREIFETTPPHDNGLRDVVTAKCVIYLDSLLQDETFNAFLRTEAQLSSDLVHEQYNQLLLYDTEFSSLVKAKGEDAENAELASQQQLSEIGKLKRTVKSLEKQVKSLEGQLASMHNSSEVDQLKKTINSLKGAVGNWKGTVGSWKRKVDELEKKLQILHQHSACRQCGTYFDCEFRSNEDCMRCIRCDTRHY